MPDWEFRDPLFLSMALMAPLVYWWATRDAASIQYSSLTLLNQAPVSLRSRLLWLPPALRGQGLGHKLLTLAEAEARRRGCTRAQLRTFDFQARGFYEKVGYRVVGVLEDYPPDGAMYWMRKELVAP